MQKKRKLRSIILAMMLAIQVMFLGGCSDKQEPNNSQSQEQNVTNKEQEENNKNPQNNNENSNNKDNSNNKETSNESQINVVQGELKVHYIDVGQADSILIQQGKNSMLIDAGNNDDSTLVRDYIKKQGITTLDYVIGTHPHEDHIGGLDYVINAFNIGSIYMPKKTATTKTYKDVLSAIKSKGLSITEPKVGQTLQLGEAKLTIMGPFTIYDDANNCSIVVKVEFGQNSFLFTGDAEGTSEMAMVSANLNLKSDVLKIGHHGSKTSTVAEFLNKVNPQYAVISVGKNNDYKHPTEGVMNRLKNKNIKVYRTDEQGTIIATSNGKEIKFNKSPGSYKAYEGTGGNSQSNNNTSTGSSNKTQTSNKVNTSNTSSVNNATVSQGKKVWLSATGEKYHSINNCGKMNPNKARQVTLEEAKKSGKEPCSKCN